MALDCEPRPDRLAVATRKAMSEDIELNQAPKILLVRWSIALRRSRGGTVEVDCSFDRKESERDR